MAEKPILFNTEMVKAILDGRTTQTRRLIKPQPQSRLAYCYAGTDSGTWGYPTATAHEFWGADFELPRGMSESEKQHRWKPPCEADDILWVRETWNGLKLGPRGKKETTYWYRADEDENNLNPDDWWRPSIHMPREAARLFLQVTTVRMQRLQEITSGEAVAEGIKSKLRSPSEAADALIAFEEVWNRTLKPADLPRYGWSANPWVWVIGFVRIKNDAHGAEGG